MANKSTVANDLRRFATFVKGLTDAADTLDDMQKIEEEANANTARIAEVKKQLQEVQAQVADALVAQSDATREAGSIIDKAKTRAGNVIADAEQQAAVRAQDMIAAAQVQADSIVAPAQAQRDVLLEQTASLNEQLVRMLEDEKTLAVRIVAAQDELDVTAGKLAAARESISRILL